ncbi:hypothetical protein [Paenisporosarcina quisquiliarum]|uniref:hypothetical protein n=1 Tax=Paenisporosarcina quisquiliarum TaxID=365346 RepID=UPI00373616AF
MTAASFSSIQPNMRSQSVSEQPLSLKQGQVFHGNIKKLYPNQTAEVQVGNQKMIAKLEVPLKAGDSHYFQVTSVKPELQLKVVTGALPQTSSPSVQIQQLMDSLQLPKTPTMQALVQHMVKEQIPLSKDQLVQAEQWIKNLPPQVKLADAVQALQRMSEMKLPFTNEIFRSIISGGDKTGLNTLLDSLKQTLQSDQSLPPVQKAAIQQTLNQITQPLSKELGGTIVGKALETLLSPNSSVSDKSSLLSMLKEVGLVPKQASISNFLNPSSTISASSKTESQGTIGQQLIQLHQSTPSQVQTNVQALQTSIQQNQLLSNEVKLQLQTQLQRLENTPVNSQAWKTSVKTMTNEIVKAFASLSQTAPLQTDVQGNAPKEHILSLLQSLNGTAPNSKVFQQLTSVASQSTQIPVQQVLSQAELAVQSGVNQKTIELAMKQVLQDLGFSYEAKLGQLGSNLTQMSETLKPQLLALLQDPSISMPMKEVADTIITRMNGLQILSGENGPQHQLLMQVPLDFLGKKMDATLQWNGRMKEDGKIDSNYARVMFYLDLNALKETVIDMQVQNRVVTVTIFNENDALQAVAEPFKDALKDGLQALDYQLSGVFMKQFEKQPIPGLDRQHQVPTQGVDIKI